MKTSDIIQLKPDKELVRSALNGRVFYERVDVTGASAEMLKNAGIKVAKAFPDFEVWVTCGPWRPYDVRYQVDWKQKIIALDFYSVRPGFKHLPEIIKKIRQLLKEKEANDHAS
jgi:hypothetical protein